MTDKPKSTRSPGGVLLLDDFRDNMIIDRYDVGFLSMRGAKTDSMRSENSEDALTWNVFRSLAQVDPTFWLPRLLQPVPTFGPLRAPKLEVRPQCRIEATVRRAGHSI